MNPILGQQPMLNPEWAARATQEWGAWVRTLTDDELLAAAATEEAVRYLGTGLSSEVVAALIRLRLGLARSAADDRQRISVELAYSDRVRKDVADLLAAHLLAPDAAAAMDHQYAARIDALNSWSQALKPTSAARQPATVRASPGPTTPGPGLPAAGAPARALGPSISLSALFAEHSVLILASLGAFLLVVATILFELYGSVGLGGGARLGAVVALNVIFAAAGYFAIRQPHLRSVGQIYVALAAVLLPLIAVAAWSFLELGGRGITIDQALAITGVACAFVYGGLAMRLGLRAYGEMTGVANVVAVFGASGWAGGNEWRSVGLGLSPLAYAVWTRVLRDRVFNDFHWFAHLAALLALGDALTLQPSGWQWTVTLATLSLSYLIWQALSPQPSRAWVGEAGLVLAAAAAVGPLGVSSYHFIIPMLVGIPLLVLARSSDKLGKIGTLYRAHSALVHLPIVLGVGIATAENILGAMWPLALSLWIAAVLYAADFWLGRSQLTGLTLRATIPLALAATGSAANIGAWTATLVAVAGLVYLIPFFGGPTLKPLTRHAWAFFYGNLVLVGIELHDATLGAGSWEVPTALVLTAAAFGAAAEFGHVRFSALTARAVFALAWFTGVDAIGARGWRGPFDALLALVYVVFGQVRALSRLSVASAAQLWFVHATALGALILCFTGPNATLWWRLAAALGLLAISYWWLTLTRPRAETPFLAWSALALAAICVVVATVAFEWQGTVIVVTALVLTGVWAVVGARLVRPHLAETGFAVLAATALVGVFLSLWQVAPRWSQSIALILTAGLPLAWSVIPSAQGLRPLRPGMHAAAAAFASIGLLVGASVLKLEAGPVGLLAVAIAAAHSEWNVRAKAPVERWYAIGAVLALALVVYRWPHAHTSAAVVAIDFVALAALCLAAGIRRNQWFLAYPTALLLVPALHLGVGALGLWPRVELEESWMAGLAWVIGLTGLATRSSSGRRWALATEAGATTIALGSLAAMAGSGYADPAGIALLAYAPQVYTVAMQERQRWALPVAAGVAVLGIITLLYAHDADTILYAAALGGLGLLIWVAGLAASVYLRRDPLVEMHRYLGLGLLAASSVAGFFFPDRTGPHSLGAALAALGWVITGGLLWLDSIRFGSRPNRYVGLFAATTAGYFLAREVSMPAWQLVPPGLGLISCGILLRRDTRFVVDRRVRRLIAAAGLGLVMGWAVVLTVTGDPTWLVILLVEGAVTVAAGIVLRSRVLLGGGGVALALASLRALINVAQAGYLFAAFAAVALVLLVVATALALGRERYRVRTQDMREQLAQWD